jgi:hypothetical protein
VDGDRLTHNPEVAGSNPAPATSFCRSRPFPSEEGAFCVPGAVVKRVVETGVCAARQCDEGDGRHGMRQPGRGGRYRPRSLGAWPRGPHAYPALFPFALDHPEHAEPRSGRATGDETRLSMGRSSSGVLPVSILHPAWSGGCSDIASAFPMGIRVPSGLASATGTLTSRTPLSYRAVTSAGSTPAGSVTSRASDP